MGRLTPDLKVHIWNRLARLHVNDLDIDGQGNTLLSIGDVFANPLTRNI